MAGRRRVAGLRLRTVASRRPRSAQYHAILGLPASLRYSVLAAQDITWIRFHPSRLLPVNRLAAETSPYLLQHAENPVDWYPWGEEALARARGEDRPILLSVGYSACHWCHVMAHESFEDDDTAAYMNTH